MKLWAIGIGLAVAFAPPALAASRRVDFSGTVVEIGLGDEPGDLASDVTTSLSIGTPFAGYFTFDDADLPYGSTETEANYAFVAPPWTLETTLGDYAIQPAYYSDFEPVPPPDVYYQIAVYDSEFGDGTSVGGFGSSASGAGAGSLDMLHTQLDLYAPPNLLSSTAIAAVPWDPSLYHTLQIRWVFERDNEMIEVFGAISAISGVPEPSSSLLLAFGLAGFGLRRIRS